MGVRTDVPKLRKALRAIRYQWVSNPWYISGLSAWVLMDTHANLDDGNYARGIVDESILRHPTRL